MNAPNPAAIFLSEAEDLLVSIEEIALSLTPAQPAGEPVNQLFRAFHTLKGSGAMFGFDSVAGFTHHVETILDKARDGTVLVSDELIQLVLRAKDHIKLLMDATQNQTEPPAAESAEIIAAIQALLAQPGAPASKLEPPSAGPGVTTASDDHQPQRKFRIRFRPDAGLMASGTNPVALLNEIRALGPCAIVADTAAVPELSQLQPDRCYLAWEMTLTTPHDINAIKDVFIFVESSELEISALDGSTAAKSTADVPREVAAPATKPAPPKSDGKSGVSASRAQTAGKFQTREATVRVPSERLDRLVNLVGEVVMNQSRLTQVAATAGIPSLSNSVEELERVVAELRDTVLGVRMMPIGTTFSRFKRLVHDLSSELGKEIDLVTEGEDTEIDKTVLDQLGDPLVHIIRNSIDHGIEPPGERLKLGKPRHGQIRLSAAHLGSNVVITIADDGRGIDHQKVWTKAVEKGFIAPDAALSERDVSDLVFRPGFSTASKLTSVSGRGVGMDVVKRQIDALRGQVTLTSRPGEGTKLTLTLPLTLAIIEGLLVEINRDQFIIPMAVVTENVELTRASRSLFNQRNVVIVRGEMIPYIRLREAFDVDGAAPDIEKIVIVRHGDERVGLVVDRVIGTHQTVIQTLGKFYRHLEVISGATIMGDGRVALILDLTGIVRMVKPPAGLIATREFTFNRPADQPAPAI